ncbi:hypothetical protein EDD11_002146 [Mortierella claussenii]|nr:hypothetical protein EDD11_002146 [Mortierella claussenii]
MTFYPSQTVSLAAVQLHCCRRLAEGSKGAFQEAAEYQSQAQRSNSDLKNGSTEFTTSARKPPTDGSLGSLGNNENDEDNIGPLLDELDSDFEDSSRSSRKFRRLFGAQSNSSNAQRHQSSTALKASSNHNCFRGPSSSQPKKWSQGHGANHNESAPDNDGEEWPAGFDTMDVDFRLEMDSPMIDNSIAKVTKSAASTRSMVSEAQHAIDEIDQMLMEDTDLSPICKPQDVNGIHTVIDSQTTIEAVVVTAEPHATARVKDSQDESEDQNRNRDDFPRSGSLQGEVLFEDAGDPKESNLSGEESVDNELASRTREGSKKAGEGSADSSDRSPAACHGQTNVGVDPKEDQVALPPLVFDVPNTVAKFKSRLDELRVEFNTSLENMNEAILGVDVLHNSINEALSGHQVHLDQRGRHIECQKEGLQMEAGSLHARAIKDLD